MTRFKEDEAQLRVLVSALLDEARPSNGRCLRMRVHILDHNSEQPVDLESVRRSDLGSSELLVHPSLRPMNAHGQLARSWNEALVLGFGNLNAPAADFVMTVQADAVLLPGWWPAIEPLVTFDPALARRRCDLLTLGRGDFLVLYTPEAVRRIGLWDERFTGVTDQDADYFLRARLHLADGSCVHDWHHGRTHTQLNRSSAAEVDRRVWDAKAPTGKMRNMAWRQAAETARGHSMALFYRKWGARCLIGKWQKQPSNAAFLASCSCRAADPQPVLYTPFEDAVQVQANCPSTVQAVNRTVQAVRGLSQVSHVDTAVKRDSAITNVPVASGLGVVILALLPGPLMLCCMYRLAMRRMEREARDRLISRVHRTVSQNSCLACTSEAGSDHL